MKLEPFHLERWLQQASELDIASAGITKLKLRDITAAVDPDMVMSYGVSSGSEAIRQRIADLYEGVSRENVLVTSGTAEANFLAVYRLLSPGDEMVMLLPSYLQCVGIARSLGATVKECPYREEAGWEPDLGKLERLVTRKTTLICCVNPNNPTGSVLSRQHMSRICEIADGVGAWVLCDGALRGLEVDDRPAATPVGSYRRGIATGSLSKVGITGIRIGWMVADAALIQGCWADKDYTTLCHSGIGEHLAAIALERGNYARYAERARGVIREQREVLAEWVAGHRDVLRWVRPSAGHTAFVGYDVDMDAERLCTRLLAEEGVLVSPGDYFGAPRHLRIRHSGPRDELPRALARFSSFLRRLR